MRRQASMSPGTPQQETQPTTAASSVKASDSQDVAEQKRLNDAREASIPWKMWGPYL
jgi:hypothetical protein